MIPTQNSGIIQTIFVITGCDYMYVSFFPGIGKATFFKNFFVKANDGTGQLSKTPAREGS